MITWQFNKVEIKAFYKSRQSQKCRFRLKYQKERRNYIKKNLINKKKSKWAKRKQIKELKKDNIKNC
jgi:hypothetical protein